MNKLKEAEPIKVILQGIIIPKDWNEKGELLSLAIYTFDENEYLVGKNEKEKELRQFLQEQIKVEGLVREGKRGKKTIVVDNFSVISHELE